MKINLISCLFVLDSEKNENIRKNDIKKIKVLVDKSQSLPLITYTGGDMKKELRKFIRNIIGSNVFHTEQVYTIENPSGVDVIYLGITNIENVSKLSKEYELVDFNIEKNSIITLKDEIYSYKTKEVEANNNIEYIHEIKTSDLERKRNLLYLLISYKKVRSNADNTDVLFKFMGSSFTLEDVRILYELIKDITVDKSNFRKKIIKYCEKIETEDQPKTGFRPSQKYKFKPLKGDVWLW